MGKFNRKELFLLASFASAWIVYSVFSSLYGAEATVMMNFFGISTTQQGFLITIQCIGGLGVSLLCVFFGERMSKLKMIAFGIILLSVGSLATVFSVNYLQVMMFALIGGIGYNFMDIMENAAVVEIFPDKTKTALPALHMTFGIGAVAGPFFATAVVDPDVLSSFSRPFLVVGIAGFAVLAVFLIASGGMRGQQPQKAAPGKTQNSGSIFKYPAAWVMVIAGVLYFSFQRGVSTWYPSYLIESANVSFQFSGLALTLFFLGSLACRVASPFLFNRFSILRMCVLMTVFSGVCMAASVALAPVWVGLSITVAIAGGVMQGAYVASYVFLICEMFPGKTASATGIVMIAINLGGITSPLWMGWMAEQMGFTIPLYIISVMMLGSAALIAAAHKINQKNREQDTEPVCAS
jgi:predicted MFS family arabinose efflux permease